MSIKAQWWLLYIITPPVGAVAKYCDEYICVSVCLSVREHISGTRHLIFTNFCACCLWPWLSPPASLQLLPHNAVLGRYMLSLCVHLSVTSRHCTKMGKCSITQTMPYDSPGTLVFWHQRSRRNSDGVTPNRGTKSGRVGSSRQFSTNFSLYLKIVAR